jgi:hypothetical protein
MRLLLILILISPLAGAQPAQQSATQLQQYAIEYPQEKLFIHTDKNFWVAGETSWFKIYLVSGQSHQPINTSKVAYVELVGSENQILLQTKIELSNGFGKGQINIPASVSSGNYYLRAYTRWMKNYSADFFFHQPITIVNTFRRLFDGEQQPNSDIDVQFFPEGGQWIDGINHKIAFRAVDYLGKGIDFTGTIINSNGDTLNQFKPAKFGMGTFEMKPTLQEYTALINHKGKTTAVKLPKVNATGFALQIVDTLSQFKILIKTKGVFDQPVYILAHTRQKVNFTFSQPLKNGALELMIPKSNLEAGITHITVFTSIGQPVCERLIFLKPEDNTVLSVSTDREQTSTRKKIMLDLKSKNTILSNLSVSVIYNDSLQQFAQPDIVSYLLLSSDLKGSIESPHAYLNANPETIDNLMLTHGWSRFRWEELAEPKTIQHIPEYRAHLIEASILDNQTQSPIPGVIGYVSAPGKRIELGGAITDKNGLLLVEANHLSGVTKLILQSPYEKAKLEIKSLYSSSFITFNLPPITLSEKHTQALIDKSISMQVNDAFGNHATTILPADSSAFYGTAPETYLLDDYTRFPVMEEVMREYVKSVWVRKKEDQFVIKIVDRKNGDLLAGESLVLLDGVPIFKVNDIMAFDPLKVKQLDIFPGRYFVGSLGFDGIVSYRTYKGDLGGFKFSPETVMINYEGLQQQKQFYSPRYETVPEINTYIPDGRHLLYWNPDVQIKGNEAKHLEFYTSDQPGTYKVTVQGIAADGTPLYGETTFKVVR